MRDLRQISCGHPDARRLVTDVQQEYISRYGHPDGSPFESTEFVPPQGLFVVAYVEDSPVAMGGWRQLDATDPQIAWAGPAVEVKRMYVKPQHRGRGHARSVLTHLEATARAAGSRWVVLETGVLQPEAVSLYRSCGYADVPPFGHYADAPLSLHLGKQLSGHDAGDLDE